MKKLPQVVETRATLTSAKLSTQLYIQTKLTYRNLANSAFWTRASNFIFLSYTKAIENLHSSPTETELFSICIYFNNSLDTV